MERFAEESQSRSVPRKHSPFLLPLVHRANKLVSSGNPITIDHRTSGKRERERERGEEGDWQIDIKIHSKVSVTLPYSLWRASTEWILWRVQGITVCSFGTQRLCENWMLPWLQQNVLLLEVSKNEYSVIIYSPSFHNLHNLFFCGTQKTIWTMFLLSLSIKWKLMGTKACF